MSHICHNLLIKLADILKIKEGELKSFVKTRWISMYEATYSIVRMQKALEERKIIPLTAEMEWIPTTTVELPESQAEEFLKLVDKLEQDEDVQKVFHNLQ